MDTPEIWDVFLGKLRQALSAAKEVRAGQTAQSRVHSKE
jgi:hypothetical protein